MYINLLKKKKPKKRGKARYRLKKKKNSIYSNQFDSREIAQKQKIYLSL